MMKVKIMTNQTNTKETDKMEKYCIIDIETATLNMPRFEEALDPTKGRIVAIAYKYYNGEPTVITGQEENIVRQIWKMLKVCEINQTKVIGFNIKSFDLKWLIHKRIHYMGVKGHDTKPEIIELRELLGNGNGYIKGTLKEWCTKHNISVKTKGTGLDVSKWYKKGEIQKIIEYAKEDIIATEQLTLIMLNKNQKEE